MQTEATVRDFVNRDFRAAAVFHRFGIDFCCGGDRPLADVCRAKQLEISAVMGEISRACQDEGAPPRYTEWTADELTRYIVERHHAYCREALPIIEAHARKLAKVHGPSHPELVEVADTFTRVCEEMDTHMIKEERILFPYIAQLAVAGRRGAQMPPAAFGSVEHPIRVMEQDHERAGAAMARIRELTRDYAMPESACATWRVTLRELEAFERDLHTHVHLENNVLFPKARALAAAPAAS